SPVRAPIGPLASRCHRVAPSAAPKATTDADDEYSLRSSAPTATVSAATAIATTRVPIEGFHGVAEPVTGSSAARYCLAAPPICVNEPPAYTTPRPSASADTPWSGAGFHASAWPVVPSRAAIPLRAAPPICWNPPAMYTVLPLLTSERTTPPPLAAYGSQEV